MPKKKIHLVCNAHLDPVWLWHWEDGLTEAISTFRIAADFCESHRGFVFNHNEALLYRWIEQHDPPLFDRIRDLVAAGRWHISGGAYLQPDVNNPHGESHIRQFLLGLSYFKEKFGARPRTAYNFDPFGHPEGFAQILNGCGMNSYIFCRPDYGTHDLPLGAFRWRDRSGAEIVTRRSDDHYLSNSGIRDILDRWLPHYELEPETMILWGVGNHGGGVSREEFVDLQRYMKEHPEYQWLHSTPEQFFTEVRKRTAKLPVVNGEIEHSFPGCYTSMSRVKRAHRAAESLMRSTENLCALAWWQGLAPYPAPYLDVAWRDILFCEFHDILPGSCVPAAEKDTLMMMGHAQEKLRRTRLETMLQILKLDAKAGEGEVPVFIANPHGFRVKSVVEFEYNLAQSFSAAGEIILRRNGRRYPFQVIKAENNIGRQWRTRLAVQVDLAPWEMLRLDASYRVVERLPKPRRPQPTRRALRLQSGKLTIQLNPKTGLVDHVDIGSRKSLVKPGAFRPVLFNDLDHSWTCGDPDQIDNIEPRGVWSQAPAWTKPAARFRLATAKEAAEISPLATDKWLGNRTTAALPLRIVEDGPICTVVEAMFVCGPSVIVRNYVFGKKAGSFEIRDRVLFNHKDQMLKLDIPLGFAPSESISEAPYSAVRRKPTRRYEEHTNQRWVVARGVDGYVAALTTGSCAHNLTQSHLCLNILRSPAYASMRITPGDVWGDHRFLPRHDQGEHEVGFRFLFGRRFVEHEVSQAATAFNSAPYYQVFYPDGRTQRAAALRNIAHTVQLDRSNVQITALKKAEKGNGLIVRLQEVDGRATEIGVRVHGFRKRIKTTIGAYGLKSLRLTKNRGQLSCREVNLVENL